MAPSTWRWWVCCASRRALPGACSIIYPPRIRSTVTRRAGRWCRWSCPRTASSSDDSNDESERDMKSPQRVVWTEGMLVSPQHLQQADLYHERLLDERLSSLVPFAWGVAKVAIDPGALGAEQVKLATFVGVLPDGLFLAFEGGDSECPPARPIQGHFPPTQQALDVYIGVAKEREGVPSLAADGAGAISADPRTVRTRYRTAARQVSDATGAAEDMMMSYAERNVVLLFGDEPRTDFDTIKIAEIVRETSGRL